MTVLYCSCDTGCILNGRFAYVKKPLHSVQAKKVEEKAHEGWCTHFLKEAAWVRARQILTVFLYLLAEFVKGLLSHGKGAAFFVAPDTGTLGPFETQTVDVTAYTDMWGEYRDHLICKV